MTRRSLSDSQLDAMAAARSEQRLRHHPLIQWQASFAAEPPIRLTSRHPAAIRYGVHRQEDEEGGAVEVVIEGTQVGADLSSALVDYIDGSRHHTFPVHDALLAWDRTCRRRHSRWPDHRGRPVCADVAWSVLRDRTSLAFAAEQAGVSWTRAERMLLSAVEYMRGMQERWLSDTEASASHDREYCAVCRAEAV